jgi:putative DNA primase/helicase
MTQRDFNSQVARESFPHITDKGVIKATIANLRHLFEVYGVDFEYDEMLKKQTIKLNDGNVDSDLSENSIKSQIKSLLALNDVPLSTADLISALLAQNCINPIHAFITSKKWDGIDRLSDLINTLHVESGSERYKELAVRTWLIQCVAACDSARHTPIKDAVAKFELVLVLQGGQGIGKTTWFKSLLPKNLQEYIVDGAFLDPANKDSRIEATSCWICELGELDATFKKADISRLKAFLSNDRDRMRLPYDSVTSSFKRRTSFCATVNPQEFLVDATGARRFLPVAVTECDRINMDLQQLWAQVYQLYVDGYQWWCSTELTNLAIYQHDNHTETTSMADLIADTFNMNEPIKKPFLDFRHYSITQIIIECGINNPTRDQLKQAKNFIDNNGFKQIRSTNLVRGYWVTKESDIVKNEDPWLDDFDNTDIKNKSPISVSLPAYKKK